MKQLLKLLLVSTILAGCNPTADKPTTTSLPPAENLSSDNLSELIGDGWTFIDDKNVKSELKLISDGSAGDKITLKAMSQNIEYDVVMTASDRLTMTRTGENACRYEGRIWKETDLDSYEAFSEDPISEKRPNFYRIVKGTYKCENMTETGSWAAKIND